MIFISNSLDETIQIAKKTAERLEKGDILAYFGGLGAGKTTFTHGIAEGLGIAAPVSSPTFAIVNEYHGANIILYHFDMYRITSIPDLETTGFFDYPIEKSIFVIEWAENIAPALPVSAISVTFEVLEEDKRKITIEGGRFNGSGD